MDPEVERYLAKELEGGLFVEIFLIAFGDTYSAQRIYYTVENGRVFELSERGKSPSGDTMISVKASCRRVGLYDSLRTYPRQIKDFNYADIQKVFGFDDEEVKVAT
jgi:hypothetical protein